MSTKAGHLASLPVGGLAGSVMPAMGGNRWVGWAEALGTPARIPALPMQLTSRRTRTVD